MSDDFNNQFNDFCVYKLRINNSPSVQSSKNGTSVRRVSSKHKYKTNFLITNSF